MIPKGCDKRAKKFFKKYYTDVGEKGTGSQGYTYIWDSSHEDLEETSYLMVGFIPYCVYCGCKLYPIQAHLRSSCDFTPAPYDVTGYSCICEKAMNEVVLKKQIKQAQQQVSEKKQKLIEQSNTNPDYEIMKTRVKNEIISLDLPKVVVHTGDGKIFSPIQLQGELNLYDL